jgi:putative membrane protein
MYIVYVTLMNANMAVALFLLAVFIFRGIFSESARDFVPAFTLTGAVAVATGLHMVFTAPMPSSWNIAMGEPSVLMGVLLLGAAWSISKSYSFAHLGVYGFGAGLVAMVVGFQVINLELGSEPLATGLVLLIAGFPGVMSLPAAFFAKSNPGVSRIFQWIAIVCLVVAAGMVAYTCLNGYYDHMESMANFKPIYAR